MNYEESDRHDSSKSKFLSANGHYIDFTSTSLPAIYSNQTSYRISLNQIFKIPINEKEKIKSSIIDGMLILEP